MTFSDADFLGALRVKIIPLWFVLKLEKCYGKCLKILYTKVSDKIMQINSRWVVNSVDLDQRQQFAMNIYANVYLRHNMHNLY